MLRFSEVALGVAPHNTHAKPGLLQRAWLKQPAAEAYFLHRCRHVF